MPIFLDDEPTTLTGDDLAAVLVAVRNQLQDDGRVVIEVQIDGDTLPADQLDEMAGMNIAEREVRLYSANPRELACTTLEQIRPHLQGVKQTQERAAEHLQQDNAAEAMTAVREMIEIWLQTQQAVLHTAMLLDLDLDKLTADDLPFEQVTSELVGKLQEIKSLLQSQDMVALADTLLYEWPDVVDRWDHLLGEMLAHVER